MSSSHSQYCFRKC